MIVPAADAARAVAYSPEHRRDIISLYVSRNKGFSALCRPIIYAEGTALVSFFQYIQVHYQCCQHIRFIHTRSKD